jgi:hypothetical protein
MFKALKRFVSGCPERGIWTADGQLKDNGPSSSEGGFFAFVQRAAKGPATKGVWRGDSTQQIYQIVRTSEHEGVSMSKGLVKGVPASPLRIVHLQGGGTKSARTGLEF